MKKWKLTLASGLAVLALSACSNNESVVSLKHTDITRDAFYEELKTEYGSVVMEQMLQESILLDKYKVTDKEIQTRVDYYKTMAGTETDEDFETYLATGNFDSLDDFKEQLRLNIAQIKAVTEGVKIEESAIKEAYEQQKTQVSASHILMSDEATAQDVYKKISSGEATFEQMVAEYTEDTASAANSGSLGYFSKGDMTEAFDNVVFAMKVGALSEPVKSEYGYHIIRLDDKKEVSYEALKPVIEEELKLEQAKDYSEVLASLKKEYKIDIKDETLKKEMEGTTDSTEK